MTRTAKWIGILAIGLALGVGGPAWAKGKPGGGGGGGGDDSFSNPAVLFIGPGKKSKGRLTNELFLMSSDGSQLSLGVRTEALIPRATWSPDLDAGTAGYQGAIAYTSQPVDWTQAPSLRTVEIEVATDGSVTVGNSSLLTILDGSDEGSAASLAWSPDGSKIAICDDSSADPIKIVDVGDGAKSELLANPWQVGVWRLSGQPHQRLSWSPDEDAATAGYQGRLAFVRKFGATGWEHETSLLEVEIGTDGTVTTGTIDDLTFGSGAVWSPDGTAVAYNTGTAWEEIGEDGTGVTTIWDDSAAHLDYSPDGAYLALREGGDVLIVAVGGTTPTNLGAGDRPRWCPAWSNDLD